MRVTNNTREPLDFIVKGEAKDGIPPTDHVLPGETKNIDAVEDATFKGRVLSGAITVPAAKAEKIEETATAPASSKSK